MQFYSTKIIIIGHDNIFRTYVRNNLSIDFSDLRFYKILRPVYTLDQVYDLMSLRFHRLLELSLYLCDSDHKKVWIFFDSNYWFAKILILHTDSRTTKVLHTTDLFVLDRYYIVSMPQNRVTVEGKRNNEHIDVGPQLTHHIKKLRLGDGDSPLVVWIVIV